MASLNMRLYGTEEDAAELRILSAGPLTAELDAGNLRHIRYGGVEVLRAISYIVRDRNWATFIPAIEDLDVTEDGERFEASYTAVVDDRGTVFRYRATITGSATGLTFAAEGTADGDFETNRTGFVVLHAAGVAGSPVTIEHVDGRVVEGRFPDLIDPVQPMMDLRTLTHEPIPGVTVACRMEGDTFEMEDQRNWTDASYKTYVRPLALPWPYLVRKGEPLVQSVTLTISGTATTTAAGDGVEVTLGAAAGTVPAVGVGLQPSEIPATLAALDRLAALKPRQVVYHCDPRAGGLDGLAGAAEIARALGAEAWLELVIVATDIEGATDELGVVAVTAASLGDPFRVVSVSPASDLKGTLPGSPWPPAPDAAALYQAARKAFPTARIGGGMFSYFTELNRKRPPTGDLDVVGFTTAAVVHAGDDVTVMESIEAMRYVVASARAIAGDRDLVVGPSAIGMRLNPYGAAPMANPKNIRQAMNADDPRQRGLLAAAWTVGYAAVATAGGASAVSFGGITGPHGVVGYAGPYPVFHALRALAALAGSPAIVVEVSDLARVQALAAEVDGRTVVLLANLTAAPQTVTLPFEPAETAVLDADTVEAGGFADRPTGSSLTLAPYAVARVTT